MDGEGACDIRDALRLLYLHQRDTIDAALGHNDIPVVIGRHVAHNTAARRDNPALKFLTDGVEPHKRVRPYSGLAVPYRSFRDRNAIGLRLRPASIAGCDKNKPG